MPSIRISFALLFSLLVALPAQADLPLENWLATDAVTLPHATLDSLPDYNPVKELFASGSLSCADLVVRQGTELRLTPTKSTRFRPGGLQFAPLPSQKGDLRVASAVTYLTVPIWQKGSIEVRGAAPFKLLLDGQTVMERDKSAESDTTVKAKEITLDQGMRTLQLQSALCSRDSLETWAFQVTWKAAGDLETTMLPRAGIEPRHPFELVDYPLMESVEKLVISPDGNWLAVLVSWREGSDLTKKNSLRIVEMKGKSVVWTHAGTDAPSPLLWAPDSRSLLLGFSANKATDLYLLQTGKWSLERIVKGLEDLGSVAWAPDAEGFYYTRTVKWKNDEKPYKVMWGVQDRWGGWRDDTEFRYYGLKGGANLPIARDKYGPDQFVVSPDNSALIAYRSLPDTERPFGKLEFWRIPTTGGKATRFAEFRATRNNDLVISPDGKQIAFVGPPSEVLGNDDPIENAHNTNNSDLHIVDIASGEFRNVTRTFEPDIAGSAYGTGGDGDLVWAEDGLIRFGAFHEKSMHYCTFDPKTDRITSRKLGSSGFANLAIPKKRGATTLAYRADNLGAYSDIQWFDTKSNRSGKLLPMNETLAMVATPPVRIEHYDYVNSEGVTVPGYLYYPEGYTAEGSWPLIVDTYGGVIGFGDGWMFGSAMWANRGYFIYVPIPRGANGYGEAFADAHLHEWGSTTSRDINQGVKQIVENVPGVDGARVGFDSGSYGGFLAMYLLSMDPEDPDFYPYRTAVGGYGISNIASYWGVGNWGYWYLEVSAPGYFPWNQPQWFIEQSPLYQADRIKVPLLLIHGDDDNNVPAAESDQMYTALSLLGREVVFVRFPGEGHGTANKRTNYLERKRIETEWFDKYLRDLPGAFDERMKAEFKK